jgi:hypothetical protein
LLTEGDAASGHAHASTRAAYQAGDECEALNAGSKTKGSAAYYLPLFRVRRALGLLRAACPPVVDLPDDVVAAAIAAAAAAPVATAAADAAAAAESAEAATDPAAVIAAAAAVSAAAAAAATITTSGGPAADTWLPFDIPRGTLMTTFAYKAGAYTRPLLSLT